MGNLTYGSSLRIHLDDWTLAHVQAAIGVKLHIRDSFYLTLKHDIDGDGGRGTVWIHPCVPLLFTFTAERWRPLNSLWVEALVRSASTPDGMTIVPEPMPLLD